jgi:DinB superfamily
MTEVERLATLLKQAYDAEPNRDTGWHGPSVSALLRDVSVRDALERPFAGCHTISEIVLHIAFWDEVCVRRLAGENLSVTTGSPEDWPERVGESELDWEKTLARGRTARESFVAAVRSLGTADLDLVVPSWGWTLYTMIHGTLHHDLYHAGHNSPHQGGVTCPRAESDRVSSLGFQYRSVLKPAAKHLSQLSNGPFDAVTMSSVAIPVAGALVPTV